MRILPDSNSQIGQESFVSYFLDEKVGGTYVEIGAFHSEELSNTFLLERAYKWRGLSFEIDGERANQFNQERDNKCVIADATCVQFGRVFKSYDMPAVIDYLQIDIEPASNTLKALRQALQSGYQFNVITFEHDLYARKLNYCYKLLGFLMLSFRGYRRVISNVSNERVPMEDWYVKRGLTRHRGFSSGLDWKCYFIDECSH